METWWKIYETCDAAKDGQWCSGIVSWYLYLRRLYCRVSVWRSGITFLYAPCISAYGGVQFGGPAGSSDALFGGQVGSSDVFLWSVHFCLRWSQGQARSSDGFLWSVHSCLRWSQGRRSGKEFWRFFLWSVHFCLRWSQGRRSDKELRSFFVHCAFVHTVKSKFLCAPCICTDGEFMLSLFNFL